MRRIAFVLGVFVIFAMPPVLAEEGPCTCTPSCRFGLHEKTITVGITGSLRTLFKNLSIEAAVSLTYTLSRTVTVTHECNCTPCCPGQMATSTYSVAPHEVRVWDPSQPEKLGRTIPYEIMTHLVPENFVREGPIINASAGKLICTITEKFTSTQLGGTLSLGFAAGLGYKMVSGTVTLSSQGVGVECVPICRPLEAKGCDHAPRITDYPTGGLWIPEGRSTSFQVAVYDPDWPGDTVEFAASSEEATVEYSQVGKPNEEGKRLVTIFVREPSRSGVINFKVWDECDNTDTASVPFTLIKRPVITHKSTEEIDPGWCGRGYKKAFILTYTIEDPNEGEPLDVWVRVTASGGSATIGFTALNTARICPRCGDNEVLVRFCPDPCVEKGHVTLEAWFAKYPDAKTIFGGVDVVVPNETPTIAISPSRLTARKGEASKANVNAADPDKDRIVKLAKVSGPGILSIVRYWGDQAEGVHEWTATTSVAWHLVGFKAMDCVGGSGLAYLLIHVLQPPKAYGDWVHVPKGGSSTATVYVHDPDSFSHSFHFQPPSGISVAVVGEEEPRDYEEDYGLHYILKVSVDKSLCPGSYSVPFTVTDHDGLSSQATLYVHVGGNRPPQCSPELLKGTTTVRLTPTGVMRGMVVLEPYRIWDPDEDEVVFEEIGVSPQFASSLSFILGSLSLGYETGGGWILPDYCRALREGDVLEDYFTIKLRDSCGAETEVPVVVRITVVDEITPQIASPARDKVVECDGQGKKEEFWTMSAPTEFFALDLGVARVRVQKGSVGAPWLAGGPAEARRTLG